jgi:membrane-associated protein
MHLASLLSASYLLTTFGYAGIFVVVLVESGIFFFLPGDSLLFAAGLLGALGSLNIAVVIALALVASVLGNIFGYLIGVHAPLLKRYRFFARLLKDEHIERAHDFFERHGSSALVLSRFVPGVRTFTPWVAGIARMNWNAFLRWSALGALAWTLVMTLAGFWLGKIFPGLERYLTEAIIVIVILSILPPILGWLAGRKGRTR